MFSFYLNEKFHYDVLLITTAMTSLTWCESLQAQQKTSKITESNKQKETFFFEDNDFYPPWLEKDSLLAL